MDSMPGHAGHNMNSMTNASATTTAMAMILANMTMGPGMNQHDHGSHETMPSVTNHGNHSMVGNGTMVTGHDYDTNLGEHDHSMHINPTMSNTHHEHNHDHTATDDGTMDHSNSHDNLEGHDMGGMAGHGAMYFNYNLPSHILFVGWTTTNQSQLAGACIAWFILAILHEGLRNLRDYVLNPSIRSNSEPVVMGYRRRGTHEKYYLLTGKGEKKYKSNGDTELGEKSKKSCLQRMFNGRHILLSILQVVQTTLGMLLMLVYMTFNVYLAVAVSLGSGVGYWLFAWNRKTTDKFEADHCV